MSGCCYVAFSSLCKEIANRMQSSLFVIAEVQHFLCKEIANRTQSNLFVIAEVQLFLCKITNIHTIR